MVKPQSLRDSQPSRQWEIVSVLSGALVVYVLSIAPAWHLYMRIPDGRAREVATTLFETVYVPLFLLDEKVPGRPVSWYLALCGAVAPR